jgi:spore coat protein U-like protein
MNCPDFLLRPFPAAFLRRLAACLPVFLLALVSLTVPGQASAQSCYMAGTGSFSFGTVSPDALTDTQNNIPYTCQSNASPTYYRVCMFIAQGTPIAGINPRYMTNYNGAQLEYDLYSDPARTQVIGPPPAGGGFPVASVPILVPGGYAQATNTLPIYGRVPAGQNLPATAGFQSQLGGSALYWSWSNSAPPANCTSAGVGGGNGNTSFYTSASATVSNACRITLSTDLDFGTVGALFASRDQTSTITVRCPSGTNWRLGLGNGTNASGTVRRMRDAASNYINYELYRNAARTQRWGNTPGTDTSNGTGAGETNPLSLTVYGRVPSQPGAPAGTYLDIVTVTLTY